LQAEIDLLKNSLELSQRELQNCQTEIDDIKATQSRLKTALSIGSERLSISEQECTELRNKLKNMQEELHQKDMLHAQEIIEQKKEWMSVLQTQIERSDQVQKSLKENINNLGRTQTQKLAETESQARSLEHELEDVRRERSLLEKSKLSWTTKANRREDELREKDQFIEQLADENEELQRRISHLENTVSDLEKVRRSIEGVVICIDLSGSLMGEPELRAKEAFRIVIDGILNRSPQTHVGVIVHAERVSTVYVMSRISRSIHSCLDSTAVSGCENYNGALRQAQNILTSFKIRFRQARCRVILISDGDILGGIPRHIVNDFAKKGIPCHNIVIPRYSDVSRGTEEISRATNGRNFTYQGPLSSSLLDSTEIFGHSA
jgi:Mg-chelatase subunit ChlD